MIPLECKLVRPQSRNTERSNLPMTDAFSQSNLEYLHAYRLDPRALYIYDLHGLTLHELKTLLLLICTLLP